MTILRRMLAILRVQIVRRQQKGPDECWGCAAPGKSGPCPICGR
jgi:hypothetical protein